MLVQNVETLAYLGLIARYGGAWFSDVGAPSAPGTTLASVGGAVQRPGVVEVETGATVAEFLELCGGETGAVRGFLTGGYGGAWASTDGFALVPWTPDGLRSVGGVIGASVLWATGDEDCPLEELDRVSTWIAGESAGQGGPCAFGLPAVRDDVHRLAVRSADQAHLSQLDRRLHLISNRGGCKQPGGVARFVRSGLAAFSDEVPLHLDHGCSMSRSHQRHGSSPVPPTRLASVDIAGRDFR